MEALICASCPEAHQAEVGAICQKLNIQKAFGKAGDMVDSLSGSNWMAKWEAKVVMATVTKAQTLGVRKARIICIQGGPMCDKEMASQPKLVRAIKQEIGDPKFSVTVEWMEVSVFREAWGSKWESPPAPTRPASTVAQGAHATTTTTSGLQSTKSKQGKEATTPTNATTKGAGPTPPPKPAKPAGASPISTEKQSGRSQTGTKQKPPQQSTWACETCDREFRSQLALVQHQDATGHGSEESDEEVWVCGECEKEFSTEAAVIRHQRDTGHEDPKCWCGKTFLSNTSLQRHMRDTGHS